MMRRLLTTAGLSAVSAAASRGASFAGILVVAHFLGPEGFGQFTLIQTTGLLFTTFCALSLGQMATKIVSEAVAGGERKAIETALTVSYGSAVGAAVVFAIPVVILAPVLAVRVGDSASLTGVYMAASLLVFSGFLIAVQNGVALALGQVKQQATANLLAAPLILAALVLAAYMQGIAWAVGGYVVAQALIALSQERVLWRHRAAAGYRLSTGRTRVNDWRVVWTLGLPSSFAGLLTIPAMWLAMVMLSQGQDGKLELGHFSLGNQARSMLLFGVGVVANALLPMLSSAVARQDSMGAAVAMRRSIALLLCVTGVVAALGYVAAPWAIDRFAPAYAGSIVPLQWLLLSGVATAPTAVLMRKATADGRAGVLVAGSAVFCAVLLGAGSLAVRNDAGAEGMAIAYVAASLTQLAIFLFMGRADLSPVAARKV